MLVLLSEGKRDLAHAVRQLATRVDGLAMLGSAAIPDPVVHALRGWKPVVVIAGDAAPDVEAVGAENEGSAQKLTAHLMDHGRRRLLFVGDPAFAPDFRDRYRGFVAAHRARRRRAEEPVRILFREADGAAFAQRLLAGEFEADALVCANDELALSIMTTLQDGGLAVPDDIAVVGWDDVMTARYVRPGLTTVRQPVRELGALVAERLHERVAGLPRREGLEVLPTEVVLRSSCGCPGPATTPSHAPRPVRAHSRSPSRSRPHPPAAPSPPPASRGPAAPAPAREERPVMRRTSAIVVATLTTTALALSACGRDSASGAAEPSEGKSVSEGKATGTISVWAMGAEGEKLPALAKQFEAANPGAKVEVTAIPWDAAHDKFTTAITANQTPDAAMVGTTWMGEFAGLGALDPTPPAIDKSQFFDGAWKTTEVGGTSYGIPWYVETRLVYYRTDLAKKAGFDAAAHGLGGPEGHGQGHAGQGRRQVGHRPAGRRHRVVAERHAVRLVQRRRASPRTTARPTTSTPRRCSRPRSTTSPSSPTASPTRRRRRRPRPSPTSSAARSRCSSPARG